MTPGTPSFISRYSVPILWAVRCEGGSSMSDARPPKDNQGQPSDAATRCTETRKKARTLIESARDTRARPSSFCHHPAAHYAGRCHCPAHASPARAPSRAGDFPRTSPSHVLGEILLIEDSPADIALFLYALKARALPYRLTASERTGIRRNVITRWMGERGIGVNVEFHGCHFENDF